MVMTMEMNCMEVAMHHIVHFTANDFTYQVKVSTQNPTHKIYSYITPLPIPQVLIFSLYTIAG
jgi:hypothetical protein